MAPICAACGRCLDHLGEGRYQCLLCELDARERELDEAKRLIVQLRESCKSNRLIKEADGFLTRHQARKETT